MSFFNQGRRRWRVWDFYGDWLFIIQTHYRASFPKSACVLFKRYFNFVGFSLVYLHEKNLLYILICIDWVLPVSFRWITWGQLYPALLSILLDICTSTYKKAWTRSWRRRLKFYCKRLVRPTTSSGRLWMQRWAAWCNIAQPLVASVLCSLSESGQDLYCFRAKCVHLQFLLPDRWSGIFTFSRPSSNSHPNTLVRQCTARHLVNLVEKVGAARLLSGIKDLTERILHAVTKFVQDVSPNTRYVVPEGLMRLMFQHIPSGYFSRLCHQRGITQLFVYWVLDQQVANHFQALSRMNGMLMGVSEWTGDCGLVLIFINWFNL